MKRLNHKDIDTLMIHCSATPPGMDVDDDTIKEWHVKRKWEDIGYHVVIKRDGEIQFGRSFDERGAHAVGWNSRSIGICLIGGVSKDGFTPEANFSVAQNHNLHKVISWLRMFFRIKHIKGHNEVSDKKCPSYYVDKWQKDVEAGLLTHINDYSV